MCPIVGDAVALPEKLVNLLRCPRLAFFKQVKNSSNWGWGELRGPPAREAGAQSITTSFVPCPGPPIARGLRDTDGFSGLGGRLTSIEILDETQTAEEASLASLLSLVYCLVKFLHRQMSGNFSLDS